jgi:AraC-like DNA-binding protein
VSALDTLSDVLRAVRLSGAVFFEVEGSAPWVAEAAPAHVLAPYVMPGSEHVIEYHLIVSGSCWGGLIGEPPLALEAGDLIVFPQGDAHVISSEPGLRGGPDAESFRSALTGPLPVRFSLQGGGSEAARFVCGFLGCDVRPFNPLVAALPRVIRMRNKPERDAALRAMVALAVAESQTPSAGSSYVLARLSELLFVEVVRDYLGTLPSESVGWLAGLRDEQVGRALEKLHQQPERAWTLEELAREVGMSRSSFADRFAQLVGAPPMQYLAQWRIQLAAGLLRSGQASLAEIATRVGYSTEYTLSRAFRRALGVPPATYRRSSG